MSDPLLAVIALLLFFIPLAFVLLLCFIALVKQIWCRHLWQSQDDETPDVLNPPGPKGYF